jgi:hypothetical protein
MDQICQTWPKYTSAQKDSALGETLPRPKLSTVYAWACLNQIEFDRPRLDDLKFQTV